MKRSYLVLPAAVGVAALTAVAIQAAPGSAAPTAPAAATAAAKALPTMKFLPMRLAQKAANAALAACVSKGFPVTVTVVDRDGVEIVVLRADGATGASVAVVKGKAYAAAGFRSPTSALGEAAKSNPGLISLPGFVVLAGGLPIKAGSALVGGIGVGGAPSGDIDAACATVGLKAIGF